MKNSTFITKAIAILITLNLALITLSSSAQVPNAFSYQAAVRNSSGEVISNQDVSFRISILQNSESGTTVYSETHQTTTNAFGLANLKIGQGTVQSGIFDPGGWGVAKHFIKVEIDATGGTNYVEMGTTQLLAVPYAFHAKTVENDEVEDADADATNELQSLSISGTQLTLSDGGGTVTLPASGSGGDDWGSQTIVSDVTLGGQGTSGNPLRVENSEIKPEWANIKNKPAGFADDKDNVDDDDADATNELQTLSVSGNDLTISDGNTVSLPAGGSSLWTASGDDIYYNGGKVGIGDDSPQSDLTLGNSNADITFANGANSYLIWKEGTATDKAFIGYSGKDVRLINFETGGDINLDADDKIQFQIENDTKMLVQSDGKVGISDDSPQSDLTFGNSNADITFANGAGSHLIWKEGTSTSKAWLGYDGNNINIDNFETGGDINIDAEDRINLQVNNSTKMTIHSDGHVGIGTSSPSANLHVDGTIKLGGSQSAGFTEIRRLSGTLSSSNDWTIINLPTGYNEDNTMVLTLEILLDNGWRGHGHYNQFDDNSILYELSGSQLNIKVIKDFRGRHYRVLLIKF